ncbi:TolC family protein [soil metagenome]
MPVNHRLFPMHLRILLTLSLCSSALADTISLPLGSTPSYVKQHNLELASARLRIEEAKGRLMQSGRLSNPDLGFELKHDRRFDEGAMALSFDQKFPLTSRLRLEKTLSGKAVTVAELEVEAVELKLITEAQSLVIKLLSLEQQRPLRKKQSDLALKLSDFAAKRAGTGEVSLLDATQAQVDSQRILLAGQQLETGRISHLGQLKNLLGVSHTDSLIVIGTLPGIALPGRKTNWEKRPDYQLSKLKEESSRLEVDLARSRKWEDLTAGVFVEGERMMDAPSGLERTGYLGFRLSLPLPLWNKNEGEVQEKTASVERSLLETKTLSSQIQNEAATAWAEMMAYAKLAADTEEKLLPLVLKQTENLEKAYQQGQTDLFTVLRSSEQKLQLETATLEAARDFHLARIRYEAVAGSNK